MKDEGRMKNEGLPGQGNVAPLDAKVPKIPAPVLKGKSPGELEGARPDLLWVAPRPGHAVCRASVEAVPMFLECQHWNSLAMLVMHVAPGRPPLGLQPPDMIFLN